MESAAFCYSSYLRLDELFAAPQPITPPQEEKIWASERFFIICHQTSELWISQALLDLAEAAASAGKADWAGAGSAVSRAASVMELLSQNLRQLSNLPREHFLHFRHALNGVSAIESEQFKEILLGRHNPHIRTISQSLIATFSSIDGAPHERATCAHHQCAAAWSVETFLNAVTYWRRLHVDIVSRFIGNRPGTGGTSGVDFLRKRLLADIEMTDEVRLQFHPELAERPGNG